MAFRALMPFSRGVPPTPEQRTTDPFLSFRQEMDRLFDDFFGSSGMTRFTGEGGRLVPSIDICETDDSLEIVAELPGVDEKDIDLELNGDVLTIRGEKSADREEKEKNYHLVERSYGSFARSVRLPFSVDADKINASFGNGVLTVALAKPAEAQQKTRKISVKRGDGQQTTSASQGRTGSQKRRAG